MPTEVSSSARIKARGVSELVHPAHCACCGSADPDRRYVDFDIFYDWEGQVYICNMCMEEAGNTLGMLTADETVFLIEQNNKFQARVTELEKVKVEYDRLVAALGSISADLNIVSSDSLLSPPEPEGRDRDSLVNDASTISGETELTKSIKSTAERAEHVGAPQSTSSNSTGIGLGI